MALRRNEIVTIIGSGLIGRSWSMLFSGSGYHVNLYDIDKTQLENALLEIRESLQNLYKNNQLRSHLTVDEHMELINIYTDLKTSLKDAVYVQECIPEILHLKQDLFKELIMHSSSSSLNNSCILASSTSALPISKIGQNLDKSRMIVAHPINPPYFIKLVEIIPCVETSTETINRTKSIMKTLGQCPVIISKEIPGFAVNRLQYAILNQCYALVVDGIMSAEDVDKVMTEGLGMRYAFIGPLMTSHLNANGIKDNVSRYGMTMYDVGGTLDGPRMWEGEGLEVLNKQMESMVSIEKLEEKRGWRDSMLAKLAAIKKK